MINDLSLWVAISQLVLVLLGVWIALHEDWAKRHRFLVLAAFVIAGFVGLYLTRQQSRRSGEEVAEAQRQASEANAKLSASLDRLGNQSNQIVNQGSEIKRVQGLNTELQNKLLDQSGQLIDSSKRISDLSKEGIATITGGESFCYMNLTDQWTADGLTPVFIPQGKQPLYDVEARITDMRKVQDISINRLRKLSEYFGADTNVHVGNLNITNAFIPPNSTIIIDKSERQYFVIWFTARNGTWFEDLEIRWVRGRWTSAMRVFRPLALNKKKLILTKVDEEFPGKPRWRD